MSPPRLLVLDVDGTLLTSDNGITPRSRRAIARARQAGTAVVLASARGPRALRPVMAELDLAGPAIGYGGALVWESGASGGCTVLHEARLGITGARAMVHRALRRGLEVGWYAGERWLVPRLGPGIEREAGLTGERPTVAPVLPRNAPRPHKLLCIAHRPESLPGLLALRDDPPPRVRTQLSHRNYLEVSDSTVDKARGLAIVAAHLGIELAECAAIGDGENDVGLLRTAGTGIAMGHAVALVREAADWCTDTNDREGVAKAIDRLLEPAGALLA